MDLAKFGKVCKLKAFVPFKSAQDALENINSISEGLVTPLLKGFLESNLPSVKKAKKAKFTLGVSDKRYATPCAQTPGWGWVGGGWAGQVRPPVPRDVVGRIPSACRVLWRRAARHLFPATQRTPGVGARAHGACTAAPCHVCVCVCCAASANRSRKNARSLVTTLGLCRNW